MQTISHNATVLFFTTTRGDVFVKLKFIFLGIQFDQKCKFILIQAGSVLCYNALTVTCPGYPVFQDAENNLRTIFRLAIYDEQKHSVFFSKWTENCIIDHDTEECLRVTGDEGFGF